MKQKWIAVAAFFSFFMTFSSLVSAQAEQFVETIAVTDLWYRPGGFTWAFGPSGSGSSGGGNEEAIVANELARQQRCTNIRAAWNSLKCAQKATSAPQSTYDLGIPSQYPTQTLWGSVVLAYTYDLFVNMPDTNTARASGQQAARDSLAACQGVAQCQAEVFQYFGMTTVTAPNLGSIGDVNALINALINTISGGGVGFAASEAGKVTSKYYGLFVCQGVATQAMSPLNRCGSL